MVSDFTRTDWWLTIQYFIRKLQKVVFWQVTALLIIPSVSTTLPLLYVPLAQSDHENVHILKRKFGHWNVSYIEINCTTGALHVDILQNRFKVHTNGCQWLVTVKVKWSRYRPGVAQRVGRGIALFFHDRGTRRGWVVSSMPWPHFTPGERPGTHFTGGWADPRAGLDGRKILAPPGFDPGPSSP